MNRRRAFIGVILGLLLITALPSMAVTAQAPLAPVDPSIWQVLKDKDRADILVILKEQADLEGARALQTKVEKGWYVYRQLTTTAARTQGYLRGYLDRLGIPYKAHWIQSMFELQADAALIHALAARPEVARIVADPAFNGLDDPSPGPAAPPAVNGVEWNITRVHAPDVWALSYTGQNIVVGSCDTGVDYTHPALVNQYRGNLGGGSFDHNYNWHDTFGEYDVPTDPHGHGTHTTGTMVGDDGASNQIGMAPGAQWIACKLNSGSTWKASKYIECWEWFLAPTDLNGQNPRPDLAADVINNSWYCPGIEGCDPDTLLPAAQALYAAGIAIVKSAGNAGPGCGTLSDASRYNEVLVNGAFDSSDAIADLSSRGPAVYHGETRIKPDVAAPGVNVRSSVPGGGYSSMTGTSMASPHTAGLIALLWSAHPELIGDLATTYSIVEASAEPEVDTQCPPNGPGGRPNNVWGWGIINALAAVQQAGTLGGLQGTTREDAFTPIPGAHVAIVQADNGLRRLTVSDPNGAYSATLPAATYDVTATHYGYLPATAAGVVVVSGTVTPLDLVLDRAMFWALSGTVADAISGAPLQATLSLRGTPVSMVSDPASGFYSATVAQGTYTLTASSPGYVPQERAIVVQGNLTEDFSLQPEASYYLRDSTVPCGPAFDWIDITASGAPHYLGDDSSQSVSLDGQQFTFYGNTYSALFIGSNGYVTFGAASSYPGGNTIPSPFLPNNAVYAFWDDLNPANGSQGTIYTQLVDNHLFVVEFYQVQHFPSGNPETFEILLDLDSGAILLQYLTVNDTHWTSVGLENSTGTAGVAYAFHNPAYPTATQALVFSPFVGRYPSEQGYGTLSGSVVVSGTGAPVAGATVSAQAWADGQVYSTTSAVGGSYSLTLCADLYTATASASGYYPSAPLLEVVYSGTATLQDFSLEPIVPCEPVQQADFSWQPPAPTAGQVITFTGSASGTLPIAYTWSFGDDTLGTGPAVSHTYAVPRIYAVVMTATNCATATITAVHALTVSAPPCQPVTAADFTWQPPTPAAGQVITFTGSASGTLPITYTWSFGDDTLATGPAVSHTYAVSGVYTVVMTAANCATATVAATHAITVGAPCEPLQDVDFIWQPATPTAGQELTFTAGASGTLPISYTWSLGDGILAEGQVVTHAYLLPGTYTVTLTATNGCGPTMVTAMHVVIVRPFTTYLALVLREYRP